MSDERGLDMLREQIYFVSGVLNDLEAEVASLSAERDNWRRAAEAEPQGGWAQARELELLIAERDRLREELAGLDRVWASALATMRKLAQTREREVAIIVAERDAALASLTAERERTARMRAVVEAARAYVRQGGGVGDNRALAVRLLTAVDALDAGAATGGEDE